MAQYGGPVTVCWEIVVGACMRTLRIILVQERSACFWYIIQTQNNALIVVIHECVYVWFNVSEECFFVHLLVQVWTRITFWCWVFSLDNTFFESVRHPPYTYSCLFTIFCECFCVLETLSQLAFRLARTVMGCYGSGPPPPIVQHFCIIQT